jgi:hypothetical protein
VAVFLKREDSLRVIPPSTWKGQKMPRFLLPCCIVTALVLAEAPGPFCTASGDGLSGYPFLASSDVLDPGVFRIQGTVEYVDVDGAGGMLRLPLTAGYGWFENVEVAAGIPLYLSDDAYDESVLGSLQLSGAWKYETARGGSALRLSSGLAVPTGAEYRDPGLEFFLGASTSTTFRLFRLSASARYVIDETRDSMRFTMGAASYVTGDIVVHGSLSGNSLGVLDLTGGLITGPWQDVAIFASGTAGLEGPWDFRMSAGMTWTGLRF